ncbi:ABC transporter permease [Kozakia baliensis]|uniref:ABC transporter permease n=1 Tax=Kozakia baliensis TaxID=153496 RepID=UPI0009E0406F|nr:ABC transporter permease [Kozakia baliensis]
MAELVSDFIPERTTVAARRSWRPDLFGFFRRYLSVILLVVAWQVSASLGWISPRLLASPVQIARTAWDLTRDHTLPTNLLVSLGRAAAGLALGIAVGVSLALVSGLSRAGEDIVDAPMQMLRTLPSLALVPLFILWFGIGELPKVLLVALGVKFPVYLNLYKGIRGIDPKLLEVAQTIGLSRWKTIKEIILPGALPDLLVGIRFAVGISWLMLVVAEQVNADSGIGHMMMDAEDFLRTDIILVGLAVYAILGLLSDQLVRLAENKLLVWRGTRRVGKASI